MKNVMSARDIEDLIRQGKDPRQLPENVLLTPSARDVVRDWEDGGGNNHGGKASSAALVRQGAPGAATAGISRSGWGMRSPFARPRW